MSNTNQEIQDLFVEHGFTLTKTIGMNFAVLLVYAHDATIPNSSHREKTIKEALEQARSHYFWFYGVTDSWAIKKEWRHLVGTGPSVQEISEEEYGRDFSPPHVTDRPPISCPQCGGNDGNHMKRVDDEYEDYPEETYRCGPCWHHFNVKGEEVASQPKTPIEYEKEDEDLKRHLMPSTDPMVQAALKWIDVKFCGTSFDVLIGRVQLRRILKKHNRHINITIKIPPLGGSKEAGGKVPKQYDSSPWEISNGEPHPREFSVDDTKGQQNDKLNALRTFTLISLENHTARNAKKQRDIWALEKEVQALKEQVEVLLGKLVEETLQKPQCPGCQTEDHVHKGGDDAPKPTDEAPQPNSMTNLELLDELATFIPEVEVLEAFREIRMRLKSESNLRDAVTAWRDEHLDEWPDHPDTHERSVKALNEILKEENEK